MAVKHLKPGESFSFPSEFGFTGSAKGQSAPRAHPDRSADEFGDGMAKGGRMHPYTGGPPVQRAAVAPVAKKHASRRSKPAAAKPGTVPADTARSAALGALKIGAMMGAHAARRGAAPPGAGAPVPSPAGPPMPMPAPPMGGPAGPALGGPPIAAPGPGPGDVPAMKRGGRFIQGAIKHPGRETRRAKANGVSVHEQMERDSHSSNRSLRSAGALGLRLTGGDLKPRKGKG